MTKSNVPALVGTLVVTMGLLGGGAWFLHRMNPDLVGGIQLPSSQAEGESSARRTAPRGESEVLLLGDTFSGYSTFRSAEFQQLLSEFGVGLRYADEFDQGARAESLATGEADLIVTTLDQFLQQQPQGQIVGLIDRTIGADAVVLNTVQYPELTSLLELEALIQQAQSQGETLSIAYAGDTPSEYLALVLDTKFDAFNLSDFNVIEVEDASQAWELMQDPSEQVAIAVLWEPFVTQARQQDYTVVLSSNDAPGSIVDVLVASDRLLQSQPTLVSELLEAYYRRIDTNVRDASQLQQQIAEDGELSPAEAAAVLQGIDFFTAAEAQTWMAEGTLRRRIEATAAVLVLSGRLNAVPAEPETLYSSQFLSKAAANTQTLIDLVRADNPELADRLSGAEAATPAVTPVSDTQVQAAPDIGNLNVEGQVEFSTGSAQLTATGQQTLSALVQDVQEFNPETVAVRVIGHTSQTGPADLNQRLSQQRAQVVVDFLRSQGVQHNIVAEGRGFSQLLGNVPTADPRQQRTEIRLVRVD